MKEAGVIVVGAAGKMGTRIIHIVKETPSIKVTRAIERSYYPAYFFKWIRRSHSLWFCNGEPL